MGTRAAFQQLGCEVSRQPGTSAAAAPAKECDDTNEEDIRKKLLILLHLQEEETGDAPIKRGRHVKDFIMQKYQVDEGVSPQWLLSMQAQVRRQCTRESTADVYCACLSNWGLFLRANRQYGGEKAILSEVAIEAYLK